MATNRLTITVFIIISVNESKPHGSYFICEAALKFSFEGSAAHSVLRITYLLF